MPRRSDALGEISMWKLGIMKKPAQPRVHAPQRLVGEGQGFREHADGGGSGLGVGGECYHFLFLLLLESSQASSEKASAVPTQCLAEVDMLRRLRALGDHVTVAAGFRTEHGWAGHSLQSGHGTSFSVSPPP